MDPNSLLDRIASLLRQSAYDDLAGEDLDYACQSLWEWLDKGGFEPDWSRHASAASYYRTRAVTHDRGGRVEHGA
jgi:hypothetical protein